MLVWAQFGRIEKLKRDKKGLNLDIKYFFDDVKNVL
jgi:uncharacterized protein (UPF0335 family)